VNQPDSARSTLATPRFAGFELHADFRWQDDRYGHRIAAISDRQEIVLLVAQLGGDRADWPDSPPLQQLSWTEGSAGDPVALLVGMAGKSHWSLSAEVPSASSDLLFDVACRIQRPPLWLGNTYRTSCTLHQETPQSVRFAAGNLEGHITTEPSGDSGRAAIDIAGSRLTIKPDCSRVSAPQTVRWKYRIVLRSQSRYHDE
jgi:hypothetical protein